PGAGRPLLRRRLDALAEPGLARGRAPPAARARRARRREAVSPVTDAELRRALREHAYLEGDFVLRSGRRSPYYLDKYRFDTRPELLEALGERIAATAARFAPDADRL